jgi:D-tyrosyl-tRNA(Tyr) deacylase
MLALLQRVNFAEVRIAGQSVARIESGTLALIGLEKADSQAVAERLVDRILAYRMFSDADGKMNLSLNDTGGGLLLVSQFTLAASTDKGLRPGFSTAMPPDQAEPLYDYLVEKARDKHDAIGCGQFGADMQVALENDGPVTFLLKVRDNS